jgi:LPXTG-site transpeptidase (sortase) family protein
MTGSSGSDGAPAQTAPGASRSHRLPLIGGIIMLAVGLIAVGYGVYGLVITNYITAREQSSLSDRFEDRKALAAQGQLDGIYDSGGGSSFEVISEDDFRASGEVPVMIASATDLAGSADIPGMIPEPPPPRGDALGRIVIPQINVDWAVVAGVTAADLRKGPGHMSGTPLPGQYGNSVISGHRTTYGGPFSRLDELEPGDRFHVETLIGTHTYEVVSSEIVGPSHVWVIHHRDGAWLTLTTCHPKFSSQQRLIVFAKLVGGPNFAAVNTHHGTAYDPPVAPEGTTPVPVYVPPTVPGPEPITLALDTPEEALPGDLLTAHIAAEGGTETTIEAPPGWDLVVRDDNSDDLTQAIYIKVAGESDPQHHDFVIEGSTGASARIARISGVDTGDALMDAGGRVGSGDELVAPRVRGDHDGILVTFFAIREQTTLTTPEGMDRLYTQRDGHVRIMATTRAVDAGRTPVVISTPRLGGGAWVGQSVLLRSAPADSA